MTMRNLDIEDTREKLITYAKAGLLSAPLGNTLLRLRDEKSEDRRHRATLAARFGRDDALHRGPVSANAGGLYCRAADLAKTRRAFSAPILLAASGAS
jgi:hypothetical protein